MNKDNINPVMDVTFDGRRIINGELIGPEPEIVIELSDENKYLLLNDTANFAVYLKAPDEEEKRINFGFQPDGGQMEFLREPYRRILQELCIGLNFITMVFINFVLRQMTKVETCQEVQTIW